MSESPPGSTADLLQRVNRAQSGTTRKAADASRSRPRAAPMITRADMSGLRVTRPRRPMPPVEQQQTVDAILYFDIYDLTHRDVTVGYIDEATGEAHRREPDDALVRQVKTMVNSAMIKRRNLYDFIDTPTQTRVFRSRNQAYNLEYGLRGRPTITPTCAEKWAVVCGWQVNWDALFSPRPPSPAP